MFRVNADILNSKADAILSQSATGTMGFGLDFTSFQSVTCAKDFHTDDFHADVIFTQTTTCSDVIFTQSTTDANVT